MIKIILFIDHRQLQIIFIWIILQSKVKKRLIMKTIILIAVAALVMTACGEKKETANLSREKDSLVSVINQRDATINDFLTVNSEIEQNLDAIAMREGAISKSVMKDVELNPSQADRINEDIAAINNLMQQNRKKIDEFNLKLKDTKTQSAEYQKMIEHLNVRIAGKDEQLVTLNKKLAATNLRMSNLETSIYVLTAQNQSQARTIKQQSTALHTAYFVVGESKELREKNIISKTGGLLGIGRTSQLDPNIDNSNFERIDYMQMSNIGIDSKDAKIITSHPTDSYTLEKDENNKKITNLHIIDPDKFWSASKYLVVVKD